ncbi:MAG: hypothetical protein MI723_04790 [Caulobacterales bacterium]|nr:hypothetical protein [Caulobacterales bacterium]
MTLGTIIFAHWRDTLVAVNAWFHDLRARTRLFSLKAFAVFFALNFTCFWWALLTARLELMSQKPLEYMLMSVPVAAMGALFDLLSLRVTLWAIAKALRARTNASYVAFLGIDLIIAAIATCWVLFVFIVSGWMVAQILPISESFAERADLYQGRIAGVFHSPLAAESLKNIYFGVIMGASALIPTILHASMAVLAIGRWALGLIAPRPLAAGEGRVSPPSRDEDAGRT